MNYITQKQLIIFRINIYLLLQLIIPNYYYSWNAWVVFHANFCDQGEKRHMAPTSQRKGHNYPGLILGLRPANERHHYKVMPSLISWAQT